MAHVRPDSMQQHIKNREDEKRERKRMGLKTVAINEKEQIFLDGEKVENVTAYKLESPAGGPAKLTLEMLVIVGQVAFGSEQK